MLERGGMQKRLEVKSLWGTNTRFARLIHSTTTKPTGDPNTWTPQQKANYYPTSSCKFATQDFFAVGTFLRTGNSRNSPSPVPFQTISNHMDCREAAIIRIMSAKILHATLETALGSPASMMCGLSRRLLFAPDSTQSRPYTFAKKLCCVASNSCCALSSFALAADSSARSAPLIGRVSSRHVDFEIAGYAISMLLRIICLRTNSVFNSQASANG